MFLQVYDSIWFDCRRSHIDQLDSLVEEALHHVASHGYWHQLEELTGNACPLLIERKFHE